MNISLTWADFALITGVCLAGYYLFIGLVYYRRDFLQILRSKKDQNLSLAPPQSPDVEESAHFQYSSVADNGASDKTDLVDDMPKVGQPTIEDFMDEIYACTEACGNEVSKEELSMHIRKILHKYPSLMNSSLRNVLAGVIATASQNNCSIQWSEDELNELWNG